MPTVKVRNLSNKEVGEIALPDAVFGVEYNEALVHAAVKNFLANRRGSSWQMCPGGDWPGNS